MSKVCMAAVDDNDRTFNFNKLQQRFPEIPEGVISKILAQYAHNMEKCMTILSQESEKYLYGESTDSPVANSTSSIMEPLRLDIPQADIENTRPMESLALLPQVNMTVAVPSSSGTTFVSGPPKSRHQSVDEYDYNQKLLQHQKQRLERLKREFDSEKLKLSRLQGVIRTKEEDLRNKKFRVAGNPTKTHVDHLVEETQVLRTEIDQMTQEIDNINNGAAPLGFVSSNQPKTENAASLNRSIPAVRKSASFPRTTGQFYTPSWVHNSHPPTESVHGPHPPWLPTMGEHPNSISPHDPSLEEKGWIFLPNEIISAPLPKTATEPPPPPPPEDTEQTWQCKHCTLENHGALNVCEACERPRN